MAIIQTIVSDLVFSTIRGRQTQVPRRNKTAAILVMVAVMLSSVSVFFLAFAYNQYLQTSYTPTSAALLVAASAIGLAMLVGMFTWWIYRGKKVEIDRRRSNLGNTFAGNLGDNMKDMARDLYHDLEEPIRQNPKTAMLLGLIAGFVALNHHSK